jgi:hypothetical protein
MRPIGYLIVAVVYIAVALASHGVLYLVGAKEQSFPLGLGGIIGCYVGTFVWHRQAPSTNLRTVQIGLGTVLAASELVFALLMQTFTGCLDHPEAAIPVAAIACFLGPFLLVGTAWKALEQKKTNAKSPEDDAPVNDGKPDIKEDRPESSDGFRR